MLTGLHRRKSRQQDAAVTKQRWLQRRADRHSKQLLEDQARETAVQVQPNGILLAKTTQLDNRYWTGQHTHSYGQGHGKHARDQLSKLADPIMTNPSAHEAGWKTQMRLKSSRAERIEAEQERRVRVAEKVNAFRNDQTYS